MICPDCQTEMTDAEAWQHSHVRCIETLRAKLSAALRAKAENDERYMLERDEARSQRDELAREVARLRSAMAFYANPETWCDGYQDDALGGIKNCEHSHADHGSAPFAPDAYVDCGEVARAALRGGPAPSGGGEREP